MYKKLLLKDKNKILSREKKKNLGSGYFLSVYNVSVKDRKQHDFVYHAVLIAFC